MGLGPWRPHKELDEKLQRGDLRMATAIAKDIHRELGHPISLQTALRFLPLIAEDQPDSYDTWALKWVSRWVQEIDGDIDDLAEVTSALAELPVNAEEAVRRIDTLGRRLTQAWPR